MYLYLIQQKGSNYFKVGISGNVKRRLENLQSGNPHKLYIVRYWKISNRIIETLVHNVLAEYHVHLEWFDIDDIVKVLALIEEVIKRYDHRDRCITKISRNGKVRQI
jgi:hypothetical protein